MFCLYIFFFNLYFGKFIKFSKKKRKKKNSLIIYFSGYFFCKTFRRNITPYFVPFFFTISSLPIWLPLIPFTSHGKLSQIKIKKSCFFFFFVTIKFSQSNFSCFKKLLVFFFYHFTKEIYALNCFLSKHSDSIS